MYFILETFAGYRECSRGVVRALPHPLSSSLPGCALTERTCAAPPSRYFAFSRTIVPKFTWWETWTSTPQDLVSPPLAPAPAPPLWDSHRSDAGSTAGSNLERAQPARHGRCSGAPIEVGLPLSWCMRPRWSSPRSSMEGSRSVFFLLSALAAQLCLCSSQVLRIGERNKLFTRRFSCGSQAGRWDSMRLHLNYIVAIYSK